MARNTAPKADAAEQELQKAEAEYIKLHPLAATGNDVAPITRGELRIILEDLLAQMGKAPAPEPAMSAPLFSTILCVAISIGRPSSSELRESHPITTQPLP